MNEHSKNSKSDVDPAKLPAPLKRPNVLAPPQARPPQGPAPSEGLNPQRVLAAVRHWWKWALPVGLVLGVCGAAVVRLTFTPRYEAVYWLRIEGHVPFLAFQEQSGADQSKQFVQTQIELLRSPVILWPVVAMPALTQLPETVGQEDLVDFLARSLVIRSVGDSEIYTVAFACTRAKPAADIVNAVLDSYFRERNSEHGNRVKQVVDQLEIEQKSIEEEVESMRIVVRDLAQQITGRDPFGDRAQLQPAEALNPADMRSRLIVLEVEESILLAKVAAYKEAHASTSSEVSDESVEKTISVDPQVIAAMQSIASHKAGLSQFASKATLGIEEPAYKQAMKLIEEEEKAIEVLRKALKSQTKERLALERSSKVEGEMRTLQAALLDCQVTRRLLQQRYDGVLKTDKESTGDSITLRFKQEELARKERVLELISARIVHLNTEKRAPQRVRIMEEARVPAKPVAEVPYTKMALALAVGLLAPFGLAVLKEQMTKRVLDAELLESRARLSVVGEIAQIPVRRSSQARLGVRDQRALGLFEESVDALRSNLLLGAGGKSIRFIAIASAVNEEGKTTIAVQLASSIARSSGARVLIVDGDMRAPSIHSVFEVPCEPGLTDVLSGSISLRDAIAVTRVEDVDVLPAGLLKSNPHKLLAKGRWESLLAKIPPEYQYVIVDTPPVLAASEALALVRPVDTVLMCALRDVTRLPQLQKAADRIMTTGARMGGLILNGIPTSHYASRYGTYSYLLQR